MDTRASPQLPPHVAPLVSAVALGLLSFVPGVRDSGLDTVLALPLVLFAPGYAVLAVVLDWDGDATRAPAGEPPTGQRSGERLLLSFVATLPIVTLVAVALNAVGLPVAFGPVVLVLLAVTVAAGAVAVLRAEPRRVPADPHAFPDASTGGRDWLGAVPGRLTGGDSPSVVALALVSFALLFALASLGLAATTTGGQSSAAFYLLNENETGSAVLATSPRSFTEGERKQLVVGIDNPGDAQRYSVVVLLQRVQFLEDTPTVVTERELGRYTPRVGAGETWRHRHSVTPTLTGERLRLTYLLYRGDAPADPSTETAYRSTYLWVDVADAGEATNVSSRLHTPVAGSVPKTRAGGPLG